MPEKIAVMAETQFSKRIAFIWKYTKDAFSWNTRVLLVCLSELTLWQKPNCLSESMLYDNIPKMLLFKLIESFWYAWANSCYSRNTICLRELKLNKNKMTPSGCTKLFGDIMAAIVSNYHFWKRSGARVMAICGSHVGPHIPNIGYFEVYEGIRGYMGYPYWHDFQLDSKLICGYISERNNDFGSMVM